MYVCDGMWGQGKCTQDFGGKTVVKKPRNTQA